MNPQQLFDRELHHPLCECAWCSNVRDPTGPWRRTLAVAICLVLIAAGVAAHLG